MTRQLVFIHGRSQEHKDAASLKAEWISSWQTGLKKSDLELPLVDSQIRFPYYGDTLFDLDSGNDEPADVIVMGAQSDADERTFLADVLGEVAQHAGVTEEKIQAASDSEVIEMGPLNWAWVQALLKAIDSSIPGGGGLALALFTRDVYQYLRNPGIRDTLEEGVREAMPAGADSVVVSHSLGTVIAYNLLRREGEINQWKVSEFLSLGSPLGLKNIRQGLAPISHPKCVATWFNARDPRDVVALYPLDQAHFNVTPSIANKNDIDNFTENRHGIAGYLSDAVVARRIYDALL